MALVLRHEWLKSLQRWLETEGYSRVSVRFYLACLHRLADWLAANNLEPTRLAESEILELYFAQHRTVRGRAAARGYRPSVRVAVSAWLRYAREIELLPPPSPRSPAELDARPLKTKPWLEPFVGYLRELGFRRTTIRTYLMDLSQVGTYLEKQGRNVEHLASPDILHDYLQQRTPSAVRHIQWAIQRWRNYGRAVGILPELEIPVEKIPEPIRGYLQFAREHRGLSASTLHSHKTQLLQLADFVIRERQPGLQKIPLPVLDAFLAERCRTRDEVIRVSWPIRAFLRYLFLVGEEAEDRSRWVTAPRAYQNQRVPKHLSDNQLAQALRLVDRQSVGGKKRWAVFALLVNYGLRVGEVAGLRLDEVNFDAGLLRVRRSKTGVESVYPLTPAVEEALRQYLTVRPAVDLPQLFLTSTAPYRPYASGGSLAAPCIASVLKRVHGVPGKGGHVLRHTLARRLRQSGVPLPVIRQVLGHKASASTGRYLRIALDELREVADNYAELL